jgi:hypothetical protein
MMHIRKTATLALMLAAWLVSGESALSCSCEKPPATPQEVVRKIPLLFWGRAVSMQQKGNERVYAIELWAGNAPLPTTISVRTQRNSAACGVELPLNQVELIAGSVRDGAIQAGLCNKHWVDTHKAAITEMLKSCGPFAPCPPP